MLDFDPKGSFSTPVQWQVPVLWHDLRDRVLYLGKLLCQVLQQIARMSWNLHLRIPLVQWLWPISYGNNMTLCRMGDSSDASRKSGTASQKLSWKAEGVQRRMSWLSQSQPKSRASAYCLILNTKEHNIRLAILVQWPRGVIKHLLCFNVYVWIRKMTYSSNLVERAQSMTMASQLCSLLCGGHNGHELAIRHGSQMSLQVDTAVPWATAAWCQSWKYTVEMLLTSWVLPVWSSLFSIMFQSSCKSVT